MTGVPRDEYLLDFQRKVAIRLVAKLNAVTKEDRVVFAVEMIGRRFVSSGDSLEVLRKAPHDGAIDAMSILRTSYDVMLQGLYIMSDPSKRNERAELYLDFMHVERMVGLKILDGNSSDLAKYLSQSPKRPQGEPASKKRFDAVKAKYLTKDKKNSKKDKVREHWYEGNLRDLARGAGIESEYELMQKVLLNPAVHSSPLMLKEGPRIPIFTLMVWYWQFAFRILGALAEYKGLVLDKTEKNLVEQAPGNIFNWKPREAD